MSDRKWHLEHRDGREWTGDELDAVIRAVYTDDPHNGCEDVFINRHGTVALMDSDGVVYYSIKLEEWTDMVVAWDVAQATEGEHHRASEGELGETMQSVRFGGTKHSGDPLLVRSGLEFVKAVPDGVDDGGTARFAVTIASDVCDVTIHRVRAEQIQRLAGGAFDLALWRSE